MIIGPVAAWSAWPVPPPLHDASGRNNTHVKTLTKLNNVRMIDSYIVVSRLAFLNEQYIVASHAHSLLVVFP